MNVKFFRNLQDKIDLDDEEWNQYYYSFERKEDLDDDDGSLTMALREMRTKLKSNRFNNGRPTVSYLTEYQDELGLSLKECIIHHQNIVKMCGMFEAFYNPIILVKSVQVTLQICNLAYVATTVPYEN